MRKLVKNLESLLLAAMASPSVPFFCCGDGVSGLASVCLSVLQVLFLVGAAPRRAAAAVRAQPKQIRAHTPLDPLYFPLGAFRRATIPVAPSERLLCGAELYSQYTSASLEVTCKNTRCETLVVG